MGRKQSLSNKEVVGTEGNVKLPGGAVPKVDGIQYFDAPVADGQTSDEEGQTGIVQQLDTPRDLKVEVQKIRFSPSGQQYVTVVLSFETEEQATGHELRIAEA